MGKLFRKGSRPNGGTKTAAGLKSGLEQKTTAAQLSFKRGFVDKIPLADDHHRGAVREKFSRPENFHFGVIRVAVTSIRGLRAAAG
jgi:hypothetical protein